MEENPSGSSSNGGIKEPLLDAAQDEDHKGPPPADEDSLSGNFGYNHGTRPCRDIAFLVLFSLVTLAALGLGIFSIVHHNSEYRWMDSPHYVRNESRCAGIQSRSVENDRSGGENIRHQGFLGGFSSKYSENHVLSRSGSENVAFQGMIGSKNTRLSSSNSDIARLTSEDQAFSSENVEFSSRLSSSSSKKSDIASEYQAVSRDRGIKSKISWRQWISSGLSTKNISVGSHSWRKWISSKNSDPILVPLVASMIATLLLSIPAVLGLLCLLRRYTKHLVFISLPLFILLPVALNILWFVVCARDSACSDNVSLPVRILFFVLVFIFCGIFAWIIFANLARVELTARVITTAAEALFQNLSLLLLLPALSLLLLLVLVVPAVVFIVFAYMNGKYVVNPAVDGRPEVNCGRGTGTECCLWRTEGWVPWYITLAAVALLWGASLVAQIKVYAISGTVGQWYFAKVGGEHRPLSALKKSLGQAFSSSFGTLCFSSLIFVFVRLVRNAVDSATGSQGQEGIALSLVRCCYDWLLKAIEFLTKFTVDFAAITGESFCASARETYDLLTRNLLSTVFVEVISTRLLGGIMFVVSVIYAAALWGILRGTTDLDNRIFLVTLAAWLLLLLVLSVFIAAMNIIVDTVYICYALDKDRGVVSKPEAHDVYVLLPVSQHDRASLAVRQPDYSHV